jgi:PLP dependent protein
MASVSENLIGVRERIAAAALRSGRKPEQIRLIAVSKTVPALRVREAFEAGQRDFGENRVQEAEAKQRELRGLEINWHLIGHLQTNKATRARQLFGWIQSVDSARLAKKLSEAPPGAADRLPVLIEVNLGGEGAKFGAGQAEFPALAEEIGRLRGLELCGLMTIPPFFEDAERARPYFQRLRALASEIEARALPGVSMHELSMGMSHDFEIAIEEGATLVRVGTAIFGPRPPV